MTTAATTERAEPPGVSYRTVWAHRDVQVLSVSRAAVKMGISTGTYGTMVYLARQGASQFEISLVGASSYFAALLFGFQGGILADKLSKQVALVVAFSALAALCFLLPKEEGRPAALETLRQVDWRPRALSLRQAASWTLAHRPVASMILVGIMVSAMIDWVAPLFAPFSPLRLLEPFGIELSDQVLAAGVIAMPANFGSTAAGAAVQTYVNRWVPIVSQGATFGVQEVQKNALCIVTVLGLGAISNLTGPRFVFVVAPLVVAGPIVWLLRYGYRREPTPVPSARPALAFFEEAREADEARDSGNAG